MSSFYIRLAGYGLAAILLVGLGYRIGSGHVQTKLDALLAKNWQQKAMDEEAVRHALEAQLKHTRNVAENNAQVLNELQDQTASVVADRDRARELARRLLASAARLRAGSCSVPEAGSQPSTDAGTADAGTEQLAGLLADAATECRTNAINYLALINQLRPQL